MTHPFDLSALTPAQRAITEDAINAAHVDWMTLVHKLQATKRKSLIPVEWVDLSREGILVAGTSEPDDAEAAHIHHVHRDGDMGDLLAAVEDGRHVVYGLAWYSGKISVEQTLESRPLLAQEVFLAEGAHMVDFFLMSDAERQAIYEAYHGGPSAEHGHGWFDVGEYRDFVGEAFMRGFVTSFTDLRWTMGGFTHMTTDAVIAAIREQLSELAPAPPPPPPPPAEPPHNPPFQQWMTVPEYKASGLFEYARSNYELHYLLGIDIALKAELGQELAISAAVAAEGESGPVEWFIESGKLAAIGDDGRLPGQPDVVYMVQRLQVAHRAEWQVP